MKLHHLKPADGSKKKRIRVGRGEGGRRGKTAGRGTITCSVKGGSGGGDGILRQSFIDRWPGATRS